ncbi:hypothetical protein [Bradyrhizobium sp. BR 1432]|uniref:hypothetical protein n=1 Tax=Bradyrhizobium sp. BR 1432 TaxID=3447966 RepID=UPI003EE690AE
MNAQPFGDAVEKINRRAFRLPLKTGDVGAVNPGIVSQFLLRNTAFQTDPTHVAGHKCTSFHAANHAIRSVKPLVITPLLATQLAAFAEAGDFVG